MVDPATATATALELARHYSTVRVQYPSTAEIELLAREVIRLTEILNTPITDDWIRGVINEAAHQRERWGVDHDGGKRPEDWFALFLYLQGKAVGAHYAGDVDKLLHHLISTGAALLNAHLHAVGADTRMRPGVDPDRQVP